MEEQNIGNRIIPENLKIALATPFSKAAVFGVGALSLWLAYRRLQRTRPVVSFKDQIVLITGGSRGLGLVLAREFAQEGAQVVLCARNREELERARVEIESRGGKAASFVCDVSDRDQVEVMVRSLLDVFGRIDVLVNVAGVIEVGPIEVMAHEDFDTVMAINYGGIQNTTFAVYGTMLRQGGRIMNITSIGGVVPVPHLLPYVASKFAAVGFSEGLSIEAARHGVNVTTIVPGLMRTGSFLNAFFKGKRADEMAWFSWGATLPIVSMSAERAARRMIKACRNRETFVTIGLPAKALRLFHAVAPTMAIKVLSFVNQILPKDSVDMGQIPEPGWMHRSSASSAPYTILGDMAAARNNEL